MIDPLSQLNAALHGRYEVERELGEGGMATVYLARDVKHGREVAIKVLKPDLAALVGSERFLAEIETTAKLQHPHILSLYDSGVADNLLFYVMPRIEGESLQDRLDRERQLSIEDATAIAKAVAGALHYAHDHGVLHRDIKPANILLQGDQALVADFGIALAVKQASDSRITATGLTPGTLQYMSPEQLMGDRELDRRSDVYALGAMTYEMLVGQLPFAAANQQGMVAKILTGVPDKPSLHRQRIPRNVEDAVLGALEPLPADRIASAQEFARALGDASYRRQTTAVPDREPEPVRRSLPWLAAAGWGAAAVMTALFLIRGAGEGGGGDSTPELLQFGIAPSPNLLFGEFTADPYPAVSPDGSNIAMVAHTGSAQNQLFVRPLSGAEPVALERAVNAQWPFWSPDGRNIGFFSNGKVRRTPADGGTVQDLTDAVALGGTWGPRGVILLGSADGLLRVDDGGGEPVSVTTVDAALGQTSHRFPQFLPDGEHFVFLQTATEATQSGIYVGSLSGDAPRRLSADDGNPVVVEPGWLLFVRGTSVVAQRFDFDRLELSGEPQELVTGFNSTGGTVRYLPFGAANQTLVYRRSHRPQTRLSLLDRGGNPVSELGPEGFFHSPALSPDGNRVVASRWDENTGGYDLWEIGVARGTATRLTTNGSFNSHPVWSPDSRRLIYASTTSGQWQILEKSFGGGEDRVVHSNPAARVVPHDWSSDGQTVLYTEEDGGGPEGDVWVLPLGEGSPRPFARTGADETQGHLSPDGRFVAYASDESGRFEVYVQPIEGGRREIVSTGGGTNPLWREDGRELYYLEVEERTRSALAVTGQIVATQMGADGIPGRPQRLFQVRVPVFAMFELWMYSASADGQRFVVSRVVDESQAPLLVVRGWENLLEGPPASQP